MDDVTNNADSISETIVIPNGAAQLPRVMA